MRQVPRGRLPSHTILSEEGRHKAAAELLAKMVGDEMLSEEQFAAGVSRVQAAAPEAFAAFAAQALSQGSLSPEPGELVAYFTIRRLGKILRLHLASDLKLKRATDLFLADAAVEAFVQARILLSRANPVSPEGGPPPREERELRAQAVTQQKQFMAAMDKLMPKPVRRPGRPRAKKSA